MPQRTPYLLDLGNDEVVKVQLVKASVQGVAAALGLTELPASGEVPANKSLVGKGRAAALASGAFALNLVYDVPGKNPQSAKVLCSPTKASTGLFDTLRGLKYAGKNIVEVRVPRRRVYTF